MTVSSVIDYGQYQYVPSTGGYTKKTTTVREYDSEGRVIKETTTEETYTAPQQWYPTYPGYPTITC